MITYLECINGIINDIVWGIPGIAFVLLAGLFLTVRLEFMQFVHLFHMLKLTALKVEETERQYKGFVGELLGFRAAMVSCSAMIGSGNIAGVATAVVLGGPGALLWMIVAAFIGMATKFTEIFLGIRYRQKISVDNINGGPMHYLSDGLGQKWLGIVYAVFTMFYAFIITAVVDSNTISLALNEKFSVPTIYTGICLALLTMTAIVGGVQEIGAACKFLAPFMAFAYITTGLTIIAMNITAVPSALAYIFDAAFNPEAVTGGAIGSVFTCMRYGIARGIFSNDAGLGVAGIIHATAKTKNTVEQSFWGCAEVFLDTVMICFISGIVIVLSGLWQSGLEGGALAISAFETLVPGWGGMLCLVSLCLFGYSCIISFYVYVDKAGEYLFGNRFKLFLKIIWVTMVFVGSQSTLGVVWNLADTVNGLMMIPNLIAVLYLSSDVVVAKNNYFRTHRADFQSSKKR